MDLSMRLRFKKFRGSLALVLLTSVILIGLSGCAGTKVDDNDPSSLMDDAESEIKSEHYLVAVEKLRMIKNKFPYSKHSAMAQLRMADVYYLQESYGEAAVSYETFRDLYPKHEKTSYATFRIGKSYFNDIPTNVSRDLSSAHKALESFEEYLRRFSTGPEATEARQAIVDIRKSLAERELYVADYYLREEQWASAKGRLEKMIALYPDSPLSVDAKKKLELANAKLAAAPAPAPKK
jgi:outer membrane protein assembly factor BamD